MQISSALISALLLSASSVMAAPAPEPKAKAAAAQWTIENMTRKCDSGDKTCVWSFKVNKNDGKAATAVNSYTVKAAGGKPASQSIGGAQTFGGLTVTSNWSGQFGPGEGFTTLSVVDRPKNQIVYPAYKDTQLKNGKAVKPDQKYPVQRIP